MATYRQLVIYVLILVQFFLLIYKKATFLAVKTTPLNTRASQALEIITFALVQDTVL